MAATVFFERKWEYEEGTSTGTVTAAEVRRAPYHNRLTKRSPETRELATRELRELHSRSWRSKVHVYDVQHDDGNSDGGATNLLRRGFASSFFSRENGEYTTWNLEELRSQLRKDGEPSNGRLYVLEDLTPPVMEIMGWTLQLEPSVFLRHVENAWGPREGSISSSHTLPSAWPGGASKCLDFCIRYPRLVAVTHPTALKHAHPEWREDCLKRAARYLQSRQLYPILDVPDGSKVHCIAFDHCTVSVRLKDKSRCSWEGIVLFPHSVKEWVDGHLHVMKQEFVNPEMHPQQLHKYKSVTGDVDVSNWLTSMETLREHSNCSLPNSVFSTLWHEALGHWKLHAHQMSLAVDQVSNQSVRSEQSEQTGLEAQRQLRAIIVQGAAMLSDIHDDLQKTADFFRVQSAECTMAKTTTTEQIVSPLERLQAQFTQVKTQLERHLPTLQNQIDFAIVRQQVKLAETQLEESRKAIQQADTIKRLTMLAFIYIPVQTAAAVFGMNVSELSPNPRIWVFFATAAVLLVVTLSAAGWHRLVPVIYRMCNGMFGSVRMRLCRMLRKMGIKAARLEGSAEKLSTWQRDPEPSWFQ